MMYLLTGIWGVVEATARFMWRFLLCTALLPLHIIYVYGMYRAALKRDDLTEFNCYEAAFEGKWFAVAGICWAGVVAVVLTVLIRMAVLYVDQWSIMYLPTVPEAGWSTCASTPLDPEVSGVTLRVEEAP